ncbi:4-coumarate--CoA ligase [Roseivivax halodurans JCM 10272]|uniref:4-coumarate--CoA ligase n=1 Tax=Roseivivax halodurans JCM 10272 TaxID=1449350 RepID=X7EIF1_9RHOB|nr:4-coumarate--CoA ligase [Roseivivax halodurans]ETX15874.1 4-coumarate--CoA ligase [Roseivivax halodurans JCM 10272]
MASPAGKDAEHPGASWIDEHSVRRLCIAVIAATQDRMIREGRLAPDTHIHVAMIRAAGEPDAIRIDEPDLGLDSLARIDLVSDLTGFFDLSATGAEDYLLIERTLGAWVRRIAWHLDHMGGDAAIGFSTSGSTGKPRIILRGRAELDHEIRAIVSGVLPNRPERVLSLVSPRHLYGFLWGILLPRALGVECLELDAASPTGIARKARPGDLIVATPFQWDRCSALGLLPGKICGVSSGGATTEETWSVAGALRLEWFLEIYGSTETGGVGVRRSDQEPFLLFPNLARIGDGVSRRGSTSEIALPDRIEWQDATRFRLGGRKDGVVQVAATNVDPQEVAARIAALPGVSDAAVRLGGERLKAFVVPMPGRDLTELDAGIRRAMTALPPPARPDRITFGVSIPRTAMGKLSDW